MTLLNVSAAVALTGLVAWYFLVGPKTLVGPLQIGPLSLELSTMNLALSGTQGRSTLLTGRVGVSMPPLSPSPQVCQERTAGGSHSRCVEWPGLVRLEVQHDKKAKDQCFSIKWSALQVGYHPTDCFSLKGAHWYGGPEVHRQLWPINQQSSKMQPFTAGDFLFSPEYSTPGYGKYGPIVEPYWISSRGVGIHVDPRVTLHASFNEANDDRLCLKASPGGHPKGDVYQTLSYNVCYASNVKEVHQLMSAKFIPGPRDIPDPRMFSSPIWSTWARFKIHVNQSKVLALAREILQHGFCNSQLEIDDIWTPTYGEYTFDLKKFPDPLGMVNELKSMGFRVTSWVTPFANIDSPAFKEGMERGYWIRDQTGGVPALVRWWQGVGGILDVTNPEAVKWYVQRLQRLRETTGVDSFKFDAGEITFVPPMETSVTHEPMTNANQYATKYAEVVSSLGNMVEMRSAYRTQDYPIFVRMLDKDSTWGFDNGLKTMITTSLQMSITGYHFNLPDMIGGNGYGVEGNLEENLAHTILPNKELFIRWAQLNAYLPAMQFSITPWQYDQEVIDIALKCVTVHEEVVTPIVLEAAKKLVKAEYSSGSDKHTTPIISPLWWLAPEDDDALSCDSQFLVSDEILVAPITDEGARMRDIYLPKGSWKDELRGGTILGPKWLKNYKIDLHEIATFRPVR